MARKPRPQLVFSTRRPSCAPRTHGKASSEREQLLWVAFHCVQGLSCSVISLLDLVGAQHDTVSKAVNCLRPCRTGGRANCPGELQPPGRLYLRARVPVGASQPGRADIQHLRRRVVAPKDLRQRGRRLLATHSRPRRKALESEVLSLMTVVKSYVRLKGLKYVRVDPWFPKTDNS